MRQVPISRTEGMNSGALIIPDLPDIVSPIDGTVIHGRRGMREHMKKHNVTYAQDFESDWKKQKKEREDRLAGRIGRRERAEAIVNALEQLTRR